MDVREIRQQIPVCQRMVYLNTGWSGPSPVSVVDAIKRRLDVEMIGGPASPDVAESGREVRTAARLAVAGAAERLSRRGLPDQEHHRRSEHGDERPVLAAGGRDRVLRSGA